MTKKKPDKPIADEPKDADWGRFESAIDVLGKSPAQHRTGNGVVKRPQIDGLVPVRHTLGAHPCGGLMFYAACDEHGMPNSVRPADFRRIDGSEPEDRGPALACGTCGAIEDLLGFGPGSLIVPHSPSRSGL